MGKCFKCNNDVISNDSFIVKECNHIFCVKCMREHVSKCLKLYISKNVVCSVTIIPCSITCLLDTCQKKIQEPIIRECLSNLETILYDQLSVLASSKEAVKCLTKNCPYVVFVEKRVEKFQCQYCNQLNCLKCKKRHDGKCNRNNMDETKIDQLAEQIMQFRIRCNLEEYYKSNDEIPNPDFFDCPVCDGYILPRKGLLLRKCYHCFCRTCFDKMLKNASTIEDLVCPICLEEINDREIIHVIGKSNFNDLICKSIRNKYFQCKFPNCNGSWDNNNFTGCFTCPVCKHVNCIECNDVHEGVSCEKFKISQVFLNQREFHETLGKSSVKCFFCSRDIFIKEGGCGSLQCKCKRYICRYTGKAAGNTGSNSCGCTPAKLCHTDCKHGCFSERNS